LRSHLDGCIQMKSFLAGEAEIRLGLNEDLQVGAEEKRRGFGGVTLDDCNFHENAQLELFDRERQISIVAPDGEVRLVVCSSLSCICSSLSRICSLRTESCLSKPAVW